MILAEWTAHPARRRPRDVLLVVCVLCLTASAVMTAFQSGWLAILSVVILVASISTFLFPTRYVLSDEGVEERRLGHRRRRAWNELRRVQVGPRAALVSPFSRPRFMDRYRGLMLYLDGADRDRVVGILEERVGHG